MDRPKNILIIDDETNLTDMVKFQLSAKGYKVATASNGEEGLQRLTLFEPDLIILDINMPKMGGIEFLEKISTAHGRPRYPILVLTARANLEKTFKDIDVDGFMSKPFDIAHLISKIEELTAVGRNPLIFVLDRGNRAQAQKIEEVFLNERYDVTVSDTLDSLIQGKGRKPDFILLEYVQEDMAGAKCVSIIKKTPSLKDVPVIVYHFPDFERYRERSLQAGADKYLGNPSESYGDFVAAVKELQLKKGH